MKRIPAWLPALLVLPLLQACHEKDEPPPQGPIRRTVLIYMAAQNTLGLSGYQRRDSVEIAAGRQYIGDNDRLLVFVDDATRPRIYNYTRASERPAIVRTWEEDACSASPDVLQDVLEWMGANYPSQEYGLVMWSHADGWIPPMNATTPRQAVRPFSFGIDTGTAGMANDTKGTQMDIGDLATAIKASGLHLRYIFFDACLMQNVEVAYALRNVTDYVVGAPMSISAAGANYTHQLRTGLFSEDVTDIVRTYHADITDPAQENTYADYGIVISAVRTDRLEAIARELGKALPLSAAAGRNSADMSGVLNYQAYTSRYFYRPHNYDMGAALQRLLPEEGYAAVMQALDDAVVGKAATSRFWIGPGYYTYQDVDENLYSGISLFVPQDVYTENADRTPLGDLNEAFRQTEWYRDAGWSSTGW